MKNADMPAMPSGAIVRSRTNKNDPGSDFFVVTETSAKNVGMTKREAFAMAAMQGLCTDTSGYTSLGQIAQDAVIAADALLAALEESNER